MPTFDEELQQALGGGRPSFSDELNAALGGSAPPPAPAPQQPQQAQQQGGGLWDSILEGGSDAVRGLNAGMYWGGSDEAEGALNSLAGRGDSLGGNVEAARGANMQAEQRSPWLYNAGKLLGYVPGMIAGPATAAGRVGVSALQGAASGLLSSDSDSLDEMASDTLNGGMWGMGGGLVGEGISAGLGAIGRASENAGVGLRARNAGGTSSELNTIRQNQGIDQMQSGLSDDFRSLGLADSWKPQSAADVYRKLGPEPGQPGIMADAGQQISTAVDDATAAGTRGSWDSVRGLMDNSARGALRGTPAPTIGQQSYSNELERIAANEIPDTTPAFNPGTAVQSAPPIPTVGKAAGPGLGDSMVLNKANQQIARLNEPAPQFQGPDQDWLSPARMDPSDEFSPFRNVLDEASPRELQNQKMAFEAQGYPPDGTIRLEADAPRASAYRSAAGAVRGELGDVMEGTPQNSAFLQGNDTYSRATPIAAMAGARAARNEAGSAITNPFTYGPAAAGAGLGGAVGGIPGAAAGAALGGVTNSLMRNYGQDVAGIGMQMAQRPLDVAGGMGQYAGQFSGPVAGADQMKQEGSRGYLLPQAAQQMMQQRGSLGPYEKQFFDAANSQDTNALSNLIVRLSHTDPQFRQTILPKLQQLTAEGY
jgi:hypothetical protein